MGKLRRHRTGDITLLIRVFVLLLFFLVSTSNEANIFSSLLGKHQLVDFVQQDVPTMPATATLLGIQKETLHHVRNDFNNRNASFEPDFPSLKRANPILESVERKKPMLSDGLYSSKPILGIDTTSSFQGMFKMPSNVLRMKQESFTKSSQDLPDNKWERQDDLSLIEARRMPLQDTSGANINQIASNMLDASKSRVGNDPGIRDNYLRQRGITIYQGGVKAWQPPGTSIVHQPGTITMHQPGIKEIDQVARLKIDQQNRNMLFFRRGGDFHAGSNYKDIIIPIDQINNNKMLTKADPPPPRARRPRSSANTSDATAKIQRCTAPKCRTVPCFNYGNETYGVRCRAHKLAGMVNVRDKKCIHENCSRIPSFNFVNTTKPWYCGEHRLEDMVNVKVRLCEHPGCQVTSCYNYNNESLPVYCNTHKLEGMLNIRTKSKCAHKGCLTLPYFNYENQSLALYCTMHKSPGMINVKQRFCHFDGCKTVPYYNYQNLTTSIYCGVHRLQGMVNVVSKRCKVLGCKTLASYNYRNRTRPVRCAVHKQEGMVVKYEECVQDGCKTRPYYNVKGDATPLYCILHKCVDMVNVRRTVKES